MEEGEQSKDVCQRREKRNSLLELAEWFCVVLHQHSVTASADLRQEQSCPLHELVSTIKNTFFHFIFYFFSLTIN